MRVISCRTTWSPRSSTTVCGGKLVPRPDDNTEAVRTRLADFHAKTKLVLELFAHKELIISVDGTKSIEQVQKEIRAKLDLD